MISPVGNVIGKITSPGILTFSLQWIRVSSRSKMMVLLKELRGKLTIFSSGEESLRFLAYSSPWIV